MYLLYFYRGDIPLRVRATGGHSPSYIFGINILLFCIVAIGGYYIVNITLYFIPRVYWGLQGNS